MFVCCCTLDTVNTTFLHSFNIRGLVSDATSLKERDRRRRHRGRQRERDGDRYTETETDRERERETERERRGQIHRDRD